MSHAIQVRLLIKGGAEIIQLREKSPAVREWFEDVRLATSIARDAGVILIINDRADVAAAVGASGVHLGQDDLPPDAARTFLGENAIIGFSTHNIEQVRRAAALPIDYLAFGPIFSTLTKKNVDPTIGLELLHEAKDHVRDLPLVAIGGIDRQNLRSVFSAGADSAAMIGSVLKGETNIEENLRNFLTIAC